MSHRRLMSCRRAHSVTNHDAVFVCSSLVSHHPGMESGWVLRPLGEHAFCVTPLVNSAFVVVVAFLIMGRAVVEAAKDRADEVLERPTVHAIDLVDPGSRQAPDLVDAIAQTRQRDQAHQYQ